MSHFVTLLVGGYLLILLALFVFQRNLLYYPETTRPDPVRSGLSEMTPLTAKSADGLSLVSWYAEGKPDQPIVVYFQGNAGNIGGRGHKVRPFLDAGFGVLLVGFRSYGGNPGSPSEQGLLEDTKAALSLLEGSARPLVFYGESLGTAVATITAAELANSGKPVQALVLEAPFTSVTDAAQHHYFYVPVKWLLKDHFNQAARIKEVQAPVLIFHGERDNTMPIRFGRALYDITDEPKASKWYPNAGHNDLFDYGAGDLSVEFILKNMVNNKLTPPLD